MEKECLQLTLWFSIWAWFAVIASGTGTGRRTFLLVSSVPVPVSGPVVHGVLAVYGFFSKRTRRGHCIGISREGGGFCNLSGRGSETVEKSYC